MSSLSVSKHYIWLTLLGIDQCLLLMHQCWNVVPQTAVLTIAVKVLGMLYYSPIPSQCIQVDIERLLFSLIIQFLRSKNRQKCHEFFYQMPEFCENCNPHSSYHTTTVGECLFDIRFAETGKLTLFRSLKIFYRFERCEFIACSIRQFEHAVLYVHKYH